MFKITLLMLNYQVVLQTQILFLLFPLMHAAKTLVSQCLIAIFYEPSLLAYAERIKMACALIIMYIKNGSSGI